MSPIASPAMIDPLHAFVDGAFVAGKRRRCARSIVMYDQF